VGEYIKNAVELYSFMAFRHLWLIGYGRRWEKVTAKVLFKVLSQYSPSETQENPLKPQWG